MGTILPRFSNLMPFIGILMIFLGVKGPLAVVGALVLVASVAAAVHHAEVIAHRVGEPFGSLILAVAVTVIETGMILSIMLDPRSGGAPELARDTVFAAVMISLNLLLGLCLLFGGLRHFEQRFEKKGSNAGLTTVAVLTVLTLVLPNYATSEPGPVYTDFQLAFVATTSLILYMSFLYVQTIRHRTHFMSEDDRAAAAAIVEGESPDVAHDRPSAKEAWLSLALLLISLVGIIILAKKLSPIVEDLVLSAALPLTVVGVVIAGVVLAPESVAAFRAASRNRLQTSLNLALGSSIATIGLTIPVVAVASFMAGLPITLGLPSSMVGLLVLTLFVTSLSIQRNRTTLHQGVLHLTIFAAYLLLVAFP